MGFNLYPEVAENVCLLESLREPLIISALEVWTRLLHPIESAVRKTKTTEHCGSLTLEIPQAGVHFSALKKRFVDN